MNDDDVNITLIFQYPDSKEKVQFIGSTISSAYFQHNSIVSINYPHDSFQRFNRRYKGNLDKILEEMIHHCLPDPDEVFDRHPYNTDTSWKYYLYELLEENHM